LTNSALPINELKNDLLAAYHSGNRLIVRAPTGSGKSTQIPQFILDHSTAEGMLLILQPRRIAARMLATRVAYERSGATGQEIGFQTRFESALSDTTRALFITEGILTRMFLGNPSLTGVSAIIFDEFHERNLSSDIGLALAVGLQDRSRPDLKIIVMSATVDIEPLQRYLHNATVITSGGRLFPIDMRYLSSRQTIPVWERAAQAVKCLISEGHEGDILVFMPGIYEIRRTIECIENMVRTEPIHVLPLYGDLPAQRQNEVMEPTSRRKVIVTTNIAETSLTISGVRHVIDSGLARVNRFDPARGFNTLFTEAISRDSADQRAGRAGREAPGICIRLWSAAQQSELPMRTTPEILRVDLAETVLTIRQYSGTSVAQFSWFEAPVAAALQQANETLVLLGAIDQAGTLTPLAYELSQFPMHPRLARLLIEAGKRNCVHLACFSAALLSERSALAGKPDYPQEAYNQDIASDFYGQYCLLEKIMASGFNETLCNRYAVNPSAAKNIIRTREFFLEHCRKLGMPLHDGNDAPLELGRCILLAYPDHLSVRKDKGTLICKLRDGRHAVLNDRSLARTAPLIVATDINEKKDARHTITTTLSLATEIKEEWLLEHFESTWLTESAFEWNPVIMAIEERKRTSCLGVVLHESSQTTVTEAASTLLAETIIAKKLQLPKWDQHVDDFMHRVQWVAAQFPEQHLPAFTDDDRTLIIHELCSGETHFSKAAAKPVLPCAVALLDSQQYHFVEQMAPQSVALPSGKKLRLIYGLQGNPRIRARIQELYGVQTTPHVAAGRIPVLIEVLAPNNRSVQITNDIANFWKVQYPELKKTLSRRYPRHEWR